MAHGIHHNPKENPESSTMSQVFDPEANTRAEERLRELLCSGPQEVFHWLNLLSVHEVDPEFRACLREYQAHPDPRQRFLNGEFQLRIALSFPRDHMPARLHPHF